MASKHRFGKLSKHRTSPTASISFHSSRADDEELQLEFSYLAENDDSKIPSVSDHKSASKEKELFHGTKKEEPGENAEYISSVKKIQVNKGTSETKMENLNTKDFVDPNSLKDDLFKSSINSSGFDSESGKIDANEGWPFLREIKGKISKTLEDRISKESKIKQSVFEKSNTQLNQDALFECRNSELPTEVTTNDKPTESRESNLSPAVEVSESMTDENIFALTDILDEAKCEIMPSKSMSPISTLSSKKAVRSKSEVSVSLSSLMLDRCPSLDDERTKNNSDQAVHSELEIKKENIIPKPIEDFEQSEILFQIIKKIRTFLYFVMPLGKNVIFHTVIVILACIVSLISSWLSGFIIGLLLAGTIMWWLLRPKEKVKMSTCPEYDESLFSASETDNEPIIFKGWMNELMCDYNPDTYHVNSTQSVYIRLDGSYLRISYPKNNIPKRAMFNEPHHELHFLHQRHHDITGSTVELLPLGLSSKRLWSKKYPICLIIPNPKKSDTDLSKDASLDDSITGSRVSNTKDLPVKKYVPLMNKDNDFVMYLFSRTNREKDIWFNRFKTASKMKMLKSQSPSSLLNISTIDTTLESKRTMSMDLASLQMNSNSFAENESDEELDSFVCVKLTKELKFKKYMSMLLSPIFLEQVYSQLSTPKKERRGLLNSKTKLNTQHSPTLMWLNVLIGRIFFDFLTEDVWAKVVSERIQRKLSKIKLPNFLEGLTLKDINIGEALPKLHKASDPIIDQRGLWIDIDLSYNGSFQMTLETKLNLLRMNKSYSEELSPLNLLRDKENSEDFISSRIYNDDDDTAESSSDEELTLPEASESPKLDENTPSSHMASSSTGKRIIRLMDRFAQSSYFQNATRNKYIKRAMEEVSNTPIVLTVEIHWLTGTLALNIPPMPTDRLWYGFRKNPNLSIVARPKLGQHAVTITHVTDWIEKKLVSEFQKILVMPNMDDLIIPIMLPEEDSSNV